MQQTRVAIVGATGYTALELIRILLRHPWTAITAVTSRQEAVPLSDIHPSLTGRTSLRLEPLTPKQLAERAEVAFCCLPHVASMEIVPELLEAGLTVIDLSADYRLKDPTVYETWYGHRHTDPERLAHTVYGLPELYAERISGQRLIANPGCYTSTAILALAPLLARGLIEPRGIIIDAKSGVSGAGRTPKTNILFCECHESLTAYGVGTHRHQPEIEQVLSEVCGTAVDVIFTPHLVPMDRGIAATIYAQPTSALIQLSGGKQLNPEVQGYLLQVCREFYHQRPFVRVRDSIPATKDSAGTNYFDLTVRVVKDRVLLLACLDNLIKGASGVAVQNYNLLRGYPETTGLIV
ncbi:MAG: N-acetyl-gamma-glutamyl-phosphate reductase [Planctomycetaceae bacterium]|nr:MAG: N-acetyl-gamma-glutamyl-phosphate reductase [Planctomycetaceae bacterium]